MTMTRTTDTQHLSVLENYWNGRADREAGREGVDPRKRVHTDLLWREIWRCVGGRERLTILDAGGGTGRFSIGLAEAGHHVVHLDISGKMLTEARRRSRHVQTMRFVQGSITSLGVFEDNAFDLVLCLDAPLSFCHDRYEQALGELIRVCRSTLVLNVFSRLAIVPLGVPFDVKHYRRLNTVHQVFDTGTLEVTEELRRLQPSIMPSWHAFMPDELAAMLEDEGCRPVRASAPGALACLVEPETLREILDEPDLYEEYLEFEERYDASPFVRGIACPGGSGLLVTAQKANGTR